MNYLTDEMLEHEKRHKKLSKELINCITKEMAIQRELSLIEYKLDLYKANEKFFEEATKINKNQEEKKYV